MTDFDLPTTTSKSQLPAGEPWTFVTAEDQWWLNFYRELPPELRPKALAILRRFVQGDGL